MRTETTTRTLYQFSELSYDAKERARNWWRQGGLDYAWWDNVYEGAKECAAILGITIDNIYFCGFWSQGDGASFTGDYSYKNGAAKAIRKHAPQDETLHRIADELQRIQRRNFYGLSARITQSGNYVHEMTMQFDIADARDVYPSADAEDDLKDALRDFARWIYRNLEKEYEYLNSAESIDETIETNGYEFTEDGDIA